MLALPPRRIVAISAGGRWTGIAAVDGPDALRRFEVTVTRTPEARGAGFLERLGEVLSQELPDYVVTEDLRGARRTEAAARIEAEARTLAARRAIACETLVLADARRLVAPAPADRIAAHRALARRFPQIAACTRQPLTSKWYGYADQYWERAFAALALAVAFAIDEASRDPRRRLRERLSAAPARAGRSVTHHPAI